MALEFISLRTARFSYVQVWGLGDTPNWISRCHLQQTLAIQKQRGCEAGYCTSPSKTVVPPLGRMNLVSIPVTGFPASLLAPLIHFPLDSLIHFFWNANLIMSLFPRVLRIISKLLRYQRPLESDLCSQLQPLATSILLEPPRAKQTDYWSCQLAKDTPWPLLKQGEWLCYDLHWKTWTAHLLLVPESYRSA